MTRLTLAFAALLLLVTLAGVACSNQDSGAVNAPDAKFDEKDYQKTQENKTPADKAHAHAQANGDPANPDNNTTEKTAVNNSDTDPAKADDPKQPADTQPKTKSIVLGGGCFWCVEAVYEMLEGVTDVESGYAGGAKETANYKMVCSGLTKHAEVVRITYDPDKITLGQILKVFFTTAHDPTQLNRQGNDVGTQYRSAIFFANNEQKTIAQKYIQQLEEAKTFGRPIATTLEPLTEFFVAETYHQDFARNNPTHGYIQGVSQPKVKKTREVHSDLLK